MDSDLTLTEARDAFRALKREIGPKAKISATLDVDGSRLVYAILRPKGHGDQTYFLVEACSWRDLVEACRVKWAEHSDTHAVTTIREMALAIIGITADQGECSDAALRATFDAADIARFGERACQQATEMASNGPFSIVKLSGANDAVAA